MHSLCAAVSVLLLVVVLVLFLRNMLYCTYEVISWRNLFLLGLAHFYFLSAFLTARGGRFATVHFATEEAYFYLAATMPIFLIVFLLSSHVGFRNRFFARMIPDARLAITTPAILSCIAVTMVLTIIATVVPFLNYFGLFAVQIRGQLACIATGLATYYFISRRFNPLSWGVFLVVLVLSLLVSTTGEASRRHTLGVLVVVPWIWYFAVWRYKRPSTNLVRFGVAAFLAFFAIVIYTPFRDAIRGKDFSTHLELRTEQFKEMVTNPQIDSGVYKFILFADTASNTLFIFDNYPEPFEYEPFQGAFWYLTNPIPRFLWPGKPEALGVILQKQMDVQANLGPGIIGHGWVEGGLFGVIAYAVVFGLLVGLIDRSLHERVTNPFILSIFGSGLGNVIALPRGDTPLFALQITAGIVVAFLLLYGMRVAFGSVFAAFPSIEIVPPQPDQDWEDDQWSDHAGSQVHTRADAPPYEPDESGEPR